MSDYIIPQIAKDTWKRFGAWYGIDAIQRKFGDLKPPPEWAMAIVLIGKDAIDLVLAQVKTKYPNFLPSLPEFEQLAEPFTRNRQAPANRPSTQYLLNCYVHKRFALSRPQLAQAWTYLYRGDPYTGSSNFEIVGVLIPAWDNLPAIRVMVRDLDLDAVWQAEQARVAELHRQRAAHHAQPLTVQGVLPALPAPPREELAR